MEIILYKSPGERNLLNRSMELVATLSNVQINEPANIETPEILLNYNVDYLDVDYVYIEKFKRYYFRNDIRIENGNQMRFILESDPLMSFRSSILNSSCIAKRSSSRINPEIEDTLVSFKDVPYYEYRECATGFTPGGNGACYVLTLGGK